MVTEPENKLQHPPKMVGAAELLVQAGQAFKSGGPQMTGLLVLGIIFPQLMADWTLAIPASRAANAIENLARDSATMGSIGSTAFVHLLEIVGNFFAVYGGVSMLSWFIVGVAYLALVYLNLHHMRPWAFPALKLGQLLKDMVLLSLRRGIWLVLLVSAVVAATQAFPLTAIFLASLTLMAPVLMVAEHKGVFRSFMHSVTLGYARKTPLGGWSAFLGLATIGGLMFTLNFLIELGADGFLDFLMVRGTPMLERAVPGLPFTWGFAVTSIVHTTLTSILIALLPGFTVALYMRLHFLNRRKAVKISV